MYLFYLLFYVFYTDYFIWNLPNDDHQCMSLCLSSSVELSDVSRVWFLHCRVHSGPTTPLNSERCPLTSMSKPLSTLNLHSFLQLMEAPLVVSRNKIWINSAFFGGESKPGLLRAQCCCEKSGENNYALIINAKKGADF